jgi:hypothetical protein
MAHMSHWYKDRPKKKGPQSINGRNAELMDIQEDSTKTFSLSVHFRAEERNDNDEIVHRNMILWLEEDEIEKIWTAYQIYEKST